MIIWLNGDIFILFTGLSGRLKTIGVKKDLNMSARVVPKKVSSITRFDAYKAAIV